MSGPTTARSLLFVPGDRPDRFAKAAATGAGAVILDLEDAVAPAAKEAARAAVLAWLAEGHSAVVRVNAAGTPWHTADVDALRGSSVTVMLPKAESAAEVAEVTSRLGSGAQVVALIETARGVRDADDVCGAPGVVRAAIGNVDLAAELGVDPASHAALAYARGRLVAASAAAGLSAPIDGVTTALDSPEVLAADLTHARELGFGGKLCIHPRQVEPVDRGLAPSDADLVWARRVLEATGTAGAATGVSVLDGKMIDPPVVRRAERLLAQDAAGLR